MQSFLSFFTGSEHQLSTMFLLKGKDLLMELKRQKPTGLFLWHFETKRIVRHDPEGRTENFLEERRMFSTENYSLQIKNLGLSDSGLYQAVDGSGEEDKVIAQYHVTVQGMFPETE